MYASRSAMQKHARSSLFSAQSQSQQASVFLQTPRPPFLSAIRQKYSSSLSCSHSEPPATTLHSEPSSTSLHSEPSTTSLHSEPSSTSLHSEPSTTSLHSEFSSHVSSFEKDYEKRLQNEVEIIDEQGNVTRVVKMRTKDVYLLNAGEKILVHVNDFDQPIKSSGGLCTRFMTHLLQQPNTGLPSARDWRECKIERGVTLLEELRRRFSLPQSENMDRVLFSIWDRAFRSVKSNLKTKLFKSVSEELNKLNNMGDDVAQERVYTEDELLDGLDLINAPPNFTDSQWNSYKRHLRSSARKKLSLNGKRARADQIHSHTTGGCSYARKRDEFKLKHNREPNDLEFFGLSHEKKDGSYVTDMSRELMVKARAEVSKKVKVLAVGIPEPMNHEKQSEIAREVMMELMGPNRPGRARFHGAGVTKSQVTKFAYDTRKVRGEAVTKENRFLSDKVNYQNKQIEMQSKQIEMQNKQIEMQSKQIEAQSKQLKIMEQKVDECTGELRVFRTAFQGTYNGSATWEGIP